MKIFVNGDSNSCGTELENPLDGYEQQLGRLLGSTEIINKALAGASNDYILRTTREYLLKNNRPDFILIGWSSFEREEWFINGEYQSLNRFELLSQGFNLQESDAYKYFLKLKAEDYDYHAQLLKYWNTKIYNFHLELDYLKIPHLFFNAIYTFELFGGEPQKPFRYDWNNAFYKPYEQKSTMIEHCQAAGYKQITEGWFHYEKTAHTYWANLLYNHIKSNNLI